MVDAIFFVALAVWFLGYHHRSNGPSSGADIEVQLRHPEAKLTEIDLVNSGSVAGPATISVDVSWPDADLVEAKGLMKYSETDTSRRSLRFFPPASGSGVTLSPGQTSAIGWVKLTDDVPVRAEVTSAGNPATEPQTP